MNRNFDEIVGSEPTGGERERLRRVHELLVTAGPPPELTPRLERAPEVGNVRALVQRPVRRKATLLLAAAIAVFAVFFGGYAVGNHHSAAQVERTLSLQGTKAAPHASATLQIGRRTDGNWPMTLTVANLPKLPAHTFYEVYLVRHGRPYVSCGQFVVSAGTKPVKVNLNAPYVFKHGDTWIVTREGPGDRGAGQTVLRPV